MKKISMLLLLAFIAGTFNVRAQTRNLYVGISGGLLKNAMIMEDYSPVPAYFKFSRGKELLTTYNWAVSLGYQLSNHLSLETQLQWVNISFKERLDLLYDFHSDPIAGTMLAEVDWYHGYHYVRVPFLVHYNVFPSTSKFGLGAMAGPNFGFLTRQASKYVGVNDLGVEKQNTLNFEDMPLKGFDYGIQFGIRVQSRLYRSLGAYIEGMAFQGFPSIIDYPDPYVKRPTAYYDNLNIVNRYFTVNAGIRYEFSY